MIGCCAVRSIKNYQKKKPKKKIPVITGNAQKRMLNFFTINVNLENFLFYNKKPENFSQVFSKKKKKRISIVWNFGVNHSLNLK